MSIKKTLGGERLGSGAKMKVELHNYERSTHDLGYLWRSTMAAGTLVPFLVEVALPGDTFDINLGCDIKTHPTVGPLFGSYKVQLDIFQCPIRLYQGVLHNNKLGIGMNMSQVKLPKLYIMGKQEMTADDDPDNYQINPSCILSYLGIRGVGIDEGNNFIARAFNAVPFLSYWDIYKNYYANKQEEIGAVIHAGNPVIPDVVTDITINGTSIPAAGDPPANEVILIDDEIIIQHNGTIPDPNTLYFSTNITGLALNVGVMSDGWVNDSGSDQLKGTYNGYYGKKTIRNWGYNNGNLDIPSEPKVATFPLENLDTMREDILKELILGASFEVTDDSPEPYKWVLTRYSDTGRHACLSTQEGLAIKTYQSDLFNNWLSTEWIDGANGISEITAIDTSGGSFTLDTLNLSKKVYNMLNRIAVSGGSYDDWMEAVYTNDGYMRTETPIYHGGLSKELVFQEVVSNSSSTAGDNGEQPLGTLAGKGIMAQKHKGGKVTIKVNEPGYIMGIVSLTPRIDYSQGNKWDVNLDNMDDFHKPALDEIGFQELITEQMAWFTTTWDNVNNKWVQKSAGKQPAWINYMTNVNQTRGNFAVQDNEMFMTLNRRYEINDALNDIKDLTTYIDPTKFNFIFAQTSIDAQNFWAQIAVDMTVRRKMSAKVMPNL